MSKSETEKRLEADIRQWTDRKDILEQANLLPELKTPLIELVQQKISTLDEERVNSIKEIEPDISLVSFDNDSEIEDYELKADIAEEPSNAPQLSIPQARVEIEAPDSEQVDVQLASEPSLGDIGDMLSVSIEPPMSPGESPSPESQALSPSGDKKLDEYIKKAETPIPEKEQRRNARRERAGHKVETPLDHVSAIDQYKKMQSQAFFNDDTRGKFGGAEYPGFVGGHPMVQQVNSGELKIEADMAASQLGDLLERLCTIANKLSLRLRTAEQILDEGSH